MASVELHVVLHEPEIPQNTGNIARTCAATGAVLHLVGPLGFSLDDRHLRRAGLDYWHLLDVRRHGSLESFFASNPGAEVFYVTTKGRLTYSDAPFPERAFFVFGKESQGLPEALLAANPDRCVRIPMRREARSLNLSNSVAVVVYDFFRRHEFSGLERTGHLRRGDW